MITVTNEAQDQLEDIIESQGAAPGVRVSVVRGPHGCVHGWSLELEDDQRSEDVVFPFGGLQLLVEPELIDALEGAKIDYREDTTGIGFKIDVPNSLSNGGGGGCGNH